MVQQSPPKKINLSTSNEDDLKKLSSEEVPGLMVVGERAGKFKSNTKASRLDTGDRLSIRARAVKILEFGNSKASLDEFFSNLGELESIDDGRYKKELFALAGDKLQRQSHYSDSGQNSGLPVTLFGAYARVLKKAGTKKAEIQTFKDNVSEAAFRQMDREEKAVGHMHIFSSIGRGFRGWGVYYDEDERELAYDMFRRGLRQEGTAYWSANQLKQIFEDEDLHEKSNVLPRVISLLGEGLEHRGSRTIAAEVLSRGWVLKYLPEEQKSQARNEIMRHADDIGRGASQGSESCIRILTGWAAQTEHADRQNLAFSHLAAGQRSEEGAKPVSFALERLWEHAESPAVRRKAKNLLEEGLNHKHSIAWSTRIFTQVDDEKKRIPVERWRVLSRNLPAINERLSSGDVAWGKEAYNVDVITVLTDMMNRVPPTRFKKIHDVISKSITARGVDGDSLIDTWKQGVGSVESFEGKTRQFSHEERVALGIRENFKRMALVEAARPGSVKILHEEFGITHFGRYDPSDLIRQFDQRNETGKPYGIVVAPMDDWNGSFQGHNFERVIYETSKTLDEHGYATRIIEVEGKTRLARRLLGFNKHYNESGDNRIKFGILAAHGDGRSATLGRGWNPSSSLDVDDFKGLGVKRAMDFFEPGASFPVISCYGGVRWGLAHRISQQGFESTGSVDQSSADNIEVGFKDGLPVLTTGYDVDGNMYRNGRLIAKTQSKGWGGISIKRVR